MLKLLKNLKKTWVSVVIIVMLLCLQAWADLSLPDYTSKIVNIGIQAGGIQRVSPEVLRANQMENLLIFTKEDKAILDSYTLLSKNKLTVAAYEKEKQKYPILETEDIYILNHMSKEQRDELDLKIAKPFMIMTMLEQQEISTKIKEQILQTMPEEQKTLMVNMNTMQILQNMPEEAINEFVQNIEKTMDENLGAMIEQVITAAIKKEYEAIGIDTQKLQNAYIINIGLQMLGIALISMISAISIMLLSSKVAAYLGKTLRDKVFKRVLQFSRRRI